MPQDWRTMLKAAGWYHEEANSGPGCAVWKYSRGLGGEIHVDGEQVYYMEGQIQTLSRVASIMGIEGVEFTTTDSGEWTTWWRPA